MSTRGSSPSGNSWLNIVTKVFSSAGGGALTVWEAVMKTALHFPLMWFGKQGSGSRGGRSR